MSAVPWDNKYPKPTYEWKPILDVLLHWVCTWMKLYKVMHMGLFVNCAYKFNAEVPHLGPIYRVLDNLEYYPEGWNHIDSIVLHKPGKTNYADPT
jgi:hypothetical protein